MSDFGSNSHNSRPTRTWRNPYWASLTGPLAPLRPMMESLSDFLARPTFTNGIELGDGTESTKDPETGVETPALVDIIDKISVKLPSPEVLTRLDELDTIAAGLATDPISFTRITDVSIETPMLAANAVTADKLASVYVSVGKFIRSASFSAGSTGWAIDGGGNSEFNNVIVRGTLASGNIYATNFFTNSFGARVEIGGASDRITFYDSSGYSSALFQGDSTGLWTSGSLRVGNILYAEGAVYSDIDLTNQMSMANGSVGRTASTSNRLNFGGTQTELTNNSGGYGNLRVFNLYHQGSIVNESDFRLKHDIKDAPSGALASVNETPVVMFVRDALPPGLEVGREEKGWIAQDAPEACRVEVPRSLTTPEGLEGPIYGLDLSGMLATLWGAVQELSGEVTGLRERVAVLEAASVPAPPESVIDLGDEGA